MSSRFFGAVRLTLEPIKLFLLSVFVRYQAPHLGRIGHQKKLHFGGSPDAPVSISLARKKRHEKSRFWTSGTEDCHFDKKVEATSAPAQVCS